MASHMLEALKDYNRQEETKKLKAQIQELRDKLTQAKKTEKVEQAENLAIQLLILHYLKIIPAIDTANTKKALLLSVMLNKSKENIRKALSNIGGPDSEYKTEGNLKFVHDLFKEVGLQDEAKEVEKDLAKLHKKKQKD